VCASSSMARAYAPSKDLRQIERHCRHVAGMLEQQWNQQPLALVAHVAQLRNLRMVPELGRAVLLSPNAGVLARVAPVLIKERQRTFGARHIATELVEHACADVSRIALGFEAQQVGLGNRRCAGASLVASLRSGPRAWLWRIRWLRRLILLRWL